MQNYFQTINADDYSSTYVVGDLHDDWGIFNFALKQLQFGKNDLIVSVGDTIDRGATPLNCALFFIHTENALAVQGNHEDMMIGSLLEGDQNMGGCWIANGGGWALDYPKEMLRGIARQISKWPYAIQLNRGGKSFGICHAEVPTQRWQDLETLLNGKSYQIANKAMWGRRNIKNSESKVLGIDYTIHGHSVRPLVTEINNPIWIDQGSVFDSGTGKYGLTIMEIKKDGSFEFHRFQRDPDGKYEFCDKIMKKWY